MEISARAGERGTDFPGTSVFGSTCGTCSAEQWSPHAARSDPQKQMVS